MKKMLDFWVAGRTYTVLCEVKEDKRHGDLLTVSELYKVNKKLAYTVLQDNSRYGANEVRFLMDVTGTGVKELLDSLQWEKKKYSRGMSGGFSYSDNSKLRSFFYRKLDNEYDEKEATSNGKA